MAVATRRRLARVSRAVGPPTMLAAVVLSGLAGPVPVDVQYAVLVVGCLAVGLPHGALDWAALPLARRGRVGTRGVAVVGVLYAALGGAALLAWMVWPVAAAVGFLLLTWFHWGQGDVHTLHVDYGATHLRDATGVALTGLVRGGIPMVAPLVAFPETYHRVLATFTRPFGARAAFAWLGTPEIRLALGSGLVILTLVTLGRGRVHGAEDAVWLWDVGETAVLWVGFLLVPPVLAIGLYFVVWHSWRHLARLAVLDGATAAAIAAGDWRRPLVRFVGAAILPTGGGIALAALLWGLVVTPPSTLPGATGLGLVAVAVLTVPHTVIVTWLDRLQAATGAA